MPREPSRLSVVLVFLCRANRKAIGEFRRTHEETEMAEARRLIPEEQWEALMDLASPGSYYA